MINFVLIKGQMKEFQKKNEAIKFLSKSNNPILVLYQKDLNNNGAKKFIVDESKNIYKRIKKKY